MPGGFPLGLELCNATDVGTVTSGGSQGTAVTSSASANTLGTYTQLIASTAADACFMMVKLGGMTGGGFQSFTDIAFGAAASEKVLFQALGCFSSDHSVYMLPCNIPKGTRLAARTQSGAGSTTVRVQITLFDGAFTQIYGYAGLDTIGFTAGSSSGTALNNSGSNNTKGAYTQLIASTARDYAGLMGHFDNGDSAMTNAEVLLDLAIGGAGSEVVILPNIWCRVGSTTSPQYHPHQFLPVPIPAGLRLSARFQASSAQTLNLTLYGVYQ